MAVKFFFKKTKPDFLRHNHVKLVRSGKQYFDLLTEMIDSARESIHIQTYILGDDQTGLSVADAVIRAAQRGVEVYMMVDAYGSQSLSDNFIKRLTDAGVYFRKFRPLYKSKRFYLGRRLHHKIVVIDSSRATVGGLNLADRYNDTPEEKAWLDFALYVEGEVAHELENICLRRIKVRRHRHSMNNTSTKTRAVCPIRIRENDWASRKRDIYQTYLELFRNAQTSLTIMSAYFLPGQTFRKSLEHAAKRGVKIRVILTGYADIPLIKYAERYIYRWLFRNNVEIYEYQKNVLHAKLAIADSRILTVGSFNVNNLSAYGSIECNLDVNDERFVASVEDQLEEIIEKDCRHITEEDMRKRNVFVKLAHKVAYETFRFMFFISTKHRE
jgi:cardiolipin synthase A/B